MSASSLQSRYLDITVGDLQTSSLPLIYHTEFSDFNLKIEDKYCLSTGWEEVEGKLFQRQKQFSVNLRIFDTHTHTYVRTHAHKHTPTKHFQMISLREKKTLDVTATKQDTPVYNNQHNNNICQRLMPYASNPDYYISTEYCTAQHIY